MNVCINAACAKEGEGTIICSECGSEMNPANEFNPERLAAIREVKTEKESHGTGPDEPSRCLHFF